MDAEAVHIEIPTRVALENQKDGSITITGDHEVLTHDQVDNTNKPWLQSLGRTARIPNKTHVEVGSFLLAESESGDKKIRAIAIVKDIKRNDKGVPQIIIENIPNPADVRIIKPTKSNSGPQAMYQDKISNLIEVSLPTAQTPETIQKPMDFSKLDATR